MNDNLYGVEDIRGSTSVDLSKGIVVCPLLSFYFFFFFFCFLYFLVASMALSISLICPLWDLLILSFWDLLILSSLGSFSHFRGNTLYITRSIEDLSHFKKYSNHKEVVTIMMYAMYASASVAGTCMT